jgi:hypothetical protein
LVNLLDEDADIRSHLAVLGPAALAERRDTMSLAKVLRDCATSVVGGKQEARIIDRCSENLLHYG